mgnify:FL=1
MKTARNLSLIVLLLAMARGRTTDPVQEAAADVIRTVNEVMISSGVPVTTADLKIDGMSCMMSCGRSIEKALAALPGISKTTIQFNEGDEADHAIVTYDEKVVTDAQMIEAVKAVHNGAYKVMAVSITKQVKGGTGQVEENQKAKEKEDVTASLPEMIIPGLIELLSQVVRL